MAKKLHFCKIKKMHNFRIKEESFRIGREYENVSFPTRKNLIFVPRENEAFSGAAAFLDVIRVCSSLESFFGSHDLEILKSVSGSFNVAVLGCCALSVHDRNRHRVQTQQTLEQTAS